MPSVGTVPGLVTTVEPGEPLAGHERPMTVGANALERVTTLLAMPEPASAKLVVVMTMLLSVFEVPGTEIAPPFGAVVSFTRVTALATVFPAESVSVSDRAGAAAAEADQLNVAEVKLGDVVGVSFACVQTPLSTG